MGDKKKVKKPMDEKEKVRTSLFVIKTPSLKIKAVYLHYLLKKAKEDFKSSYKSEANLIKEKKQNNIIEVFNKIRYTIKTYNEDDVIIDLTEDDYGKYKILSENPDEESQLGGTKVKKSPKFGPIKDFWKIALINAEFFKINENDKKILSYLSDIAFVPIEGEFPNFKLVFYFDKNDFFHNDIITKEYDYKDEDDEELENSFSSEIDWKEDKLNPMKKIVKKKIKKGGKIKEIKTITKEVPSFFDIFMKEKSNLNKDFIEANFFKNDFLPNVLEYYLDIMEINYNEIESSESSEES